MSLVVVPAKRGNLEKSVEKSVDPGFIRLYFQPEIADQIVSRSGHEGVRCWGFTLGTKYIFDSLESGDEVLLSESGTGKFTHYGVVTNKTRCLDFAKALWQDSQQNPYEFIFFLTKVSRINIDKGSLLKELGYSKNDRLQGPRLVSKEGYRRYGRISDRHNVSVSQQDNKNVPLRIKLKRHNQFDVDAALKGRNIHIVFVADSGPSMFMSHVTGAEMLTWEAAASHANRVNRANETGTLHPLRLAVTIVPLSVFQTRNDLGKRDIMTTHIKDVFIANEEYIRLDEIFFCFERRGDFDYDLAVETINAFVDEGLFIHTRIASIL